MRAWTAASRRPPSMLILGPDRPPWSGKVSAVSASVPPVFAIANRLRKPLVSRALPEHFAFPQFSLPVFARRQRRVAGTASIPDAPARRHPVRRRAIACDECKDSRRLDQGPKGRAERPSLHNKPHFVERRSLRSGRSLPRAKSRGPSVETTEIITCDSPAVRRERGVVAFEPSTMLTMAPILLRGGGKPCTRLK